MKTLFFSFLGSSLLLSATSSAALQHRSATDILSLNSKAFEFQNQNFFKNSSYDDAGSKVTVAEGEDFSVSDMTLKYSQGFYPKFEGTFLGTFRKVKSESTTSNATKSGPESVGFEGKYLFLNKKIVKSAAGLHVKKALYSNTRYDASTTPPANEVVLGDDGPEYGLDYLATYYDKYFKYDAKLGYNKPSSSLSSEILYNAEAVYSFKNYFILAGIGGIYSLKTDPHSDSPSLKPSISRGNSYLFNSTNREKSYLYAGTQYAFGNFIIGIKAETILSGRSTDKGSTISFNFRWENNVTKTDVRPQPQSIRQKSQQENLPLEFTEKHFAEGFVAKISNTGNLIRINIGSDQRLELGTRIGIFNINDYARGIPIATGRVMEIGNNWSIMRINNRLDQSTIEVGYLARAYADQSNL